MTYRFLAGAVLLLALLSGASHAGAAQSWARVHVDAPTLQGVVAGNAIDYGSFQWLQLDDAAAARLAEAGVRVERVEDPYGIVLGGQHLDLAQDVPASVPGWTVDAQPSDAENLHLIQFTGPVKSEWLAQLASESIRPVQYIHPFAYVVWSTPGALQRYHGQHAHSRHAGAFLPTWRVQPEWRMLGGNGVADVVVMTYRHAPAVRESLRAAGIQLTGSDASHDPQFNYLQARIDAADLARAAQVPGVYSIQPVPTDGGLRGEMSNQINAGNHGENNIAFPGYLAYLQGIGIDGTGVIVADVDGGVHHAHPDLVNRMLPCTGATCAGSRTDAHGTHTAAIIAGDGSSGNKTANGFLRGLGMAPGAQLVDQLYSPTYTQPGGMLKLMTDSANNGALVSANSWGPAGSPRGYDGDTRQVDVGVRNATPEGPEATPLTYVLSIMNGDGGSQSQGSPDEGKNLFAIGSTRMQSSATNQIAYINDISYNSAHGPARDGRNLPHMVAPGCSVDSAVSNTGYGLMCGTSMASPHVSGAAALFIDYFR